MANIEFENLEEMQRAASDALEAEETLAVQEEATPVLEAEEPVAEADEPEVQEEQPQAEPISSKERLMRSLAGDDEEESEFNVEHLRQMMADLPRWILSQWKLIIIILIGVFIYITNGYKAQMEMMEESALEAELKDWRYRSVTRVSELTLLCRQSLLEQMLREQGDSTLQPNKTAPYVINISK